MKPMPYLRYFLFVLPMLTLHAQGDSKRVFPYMETAVQDQAVIDSLLRWKERVYLHMDRDQVEAGEPLFFKAYVYNEPTQGRFSPSGVLRLELWNTEEALVAAQYHPVRDGIGEGVLRFPKKLEDGTYELRAYTRWMQNYGEDQFFRKEIRVGESPEETNTGDSSTAEITFHPEGGHLLAGIPNRLIVKQPGSDDLKGEIIDDSGRMVIPVQPYSGGYGMAIFTPEAGMEYRFRKADGSLADLPAISPRGYALKVNNLDTDKISLEIQPSPSMGGEPAVLKGERDGHTYFIHMLEFDEGTATTLDVPKAGMPVGYMHFSLTGLDETVWAQRPVWIGNRRNLNIDVEPLENHFSQGAEAGFRIRVTDPEGNPVETDLSIAVTDVLPGEDLNLMQYINPVAGKSDLPSERGNRFLQDLRAWSDPAGTNGSPVPDEIRYPVQRSLELHGTAYDLNNNQLANTDIQMLASSDSTLVIRETTTDASGVLHLNGLEVVGETQFVFRTKGEEQEQRLVKILPVRETATAEGKEVKKTKAYKKAERKKQIVEPTTVVPFDTTGVIKLKEATVLDKRKLEQELVPSLYGIRPNPADIVYQDMERPQPMDLLIRQIPGVQVRFIDAGIPVAYHNRRGGGSILWVVDGQIIRTQGDPTLSPLVFITPLDILRIEFIIDAGNTSVFGVQAPAGVMLVYTRSGNVLDFLNRKEGGLYFKGYEPNLDFDTYLSERQSSRKYRKETPATLYWNPSVETDSNGEAVIRFTSPADYSQVRLSVETLTPDGLVGSLQKTF